MELRPSCLLVWFITSEPQWELLKLFTCRRIHCESSQSVFAWPVFQSTVLQFPQCLSQKPSFFFILFCPMHHIQPHLFLRFSLGIFWNLPVLLRTAAHFRRLASFAHTPAAAEGRVSCPLILQFWDPFYTLQPEQGHLSLCNTTLLLKDFQGFPLLCTYNASP